MNQYYELLKNALPHLQESELSLPVREAGVDSIDLVLVRVTLEKSIGKGIPNSEWNNFKTIQEVIDFCGKNESANTNIFINTKSISAIRKHEINMPQMANSTLSENWLFKELGDIHWELLSKGLNANSANIKDEFGNRLYATFTRIRYASASLNNFKENDSLIFQGELKRFGLSTYISEIVFYNEKQKAKAILMTSFSTRDSIDNSKLFKSQPIVSTNVSEFVVTPEILNDYRLLRKGLLESFEMNGEDFDLSSTPVAEMKYNINPFYEINGVGLLYFASYPIISDKCESDYFNSTNKNVRWESEFFTLERDVFYFANCNTDDSILYRLNSFEFITGNRVKLFSSLYRVSDMTLMAHIFTIKEKNNF
ncbi:MAG: LnmK family bifunctional acyltransferase/decarboxylase [Bacteroidia bacterium]